MKKILSIVLSLVLTVTSVLCVNAGTINSVKSEEPDMYDVAYMQRCIAQLETPTVQEEAFMDTYRDGKVNLKDVVMFQLYIAGLIDELCYVPTGDITLNTEATMWKYGSGDESTPTKLVKNRQELLDYFGFKTEETFQEALTNAKDGSEDKEFLTKLDSYNDDAFLTKYIVIAQQIVENQDIDLEINSVVIDPDTNKIRVKGTLYRPYYSQNYKASWYALVELENCYSSEDLKFSWGIDIDFNMDGISYQKKKVISNSVYTTKDTGAVLTSMDDFNEYFSDTFNCSNEEILSKESRLSELNEDVFNKYDVIVMPIVSDNSKTELMFTGVNEVVDARIEKPYITVNAFKIVSGTGTGDPTSTYYCFYVEKGKYADFPVYAKVYKGYSDINIDIDTDIEFDWNF